MGSFISQALSSWLKSGKHIVEAAKELGELADGDFGIVAVQELESDDDDDVEVYIAGAVFHSQEDADAFIDALVRLSELAAEAE